MVDFENTFYQWEYTIDGLLPNSIKLKQKVWLIKDELLLKSNKGKLKAYLLAKDGEQIDKESKLRHYLWLTSLLSCNTPKLINGGGMSITTEKELGKESNVSISLSIMDTPEKARIEIEQYVHKFIGFTRKIHDDFIDVINSNNFLLLALNYFYEAERKSIYNSEGFISAITCLEALFNENPSNIKYKLALRASYLMGLSGKNAIESFDNLKKFYDSRSKLVHGTGTLEEDKNSYLLLRYARQCIAIFLVLLKNSDRQKNNIKQRKEKLLKEIDIAMLDEEKREKLKKEINKGLKKFKFPIPRTFKGNCEYGEYSIMAW